MVEIADVFNILTIGSPKVGKVSKDWKDGGPAICIYTFNSLPVANQQGQSPNPRAKNI